MKLGFRAMILFGAGIGVITIIAVFLAKRSFLSQSKFEASELKTANFELFDANGDAHELYRYSDRKVVVVLMLGNECPSLRDEIEKFKETLDRFGPRKVAFLGLNSSPMETRESLYALAKDLKLDLPILRDPSQLVAEELQLTAVGMAAVVNTKNWQVTFRGPLANVRHAIVAAVRGFDTGVVENAGGLCPINPIKLDDIDYGREIAPIILDKCVKCHSEAGAIPPHFANYESVRAWSAMIRETVMTGRMPIWGVDSDPGEFVNDNSLSPKQKRQLIKWLDSGAPKREGKDPLVGYVPKINRIPPRGASYVVSVDEEVEIPPEGFKDYKYFQLGGPLPRDMWVEAVEAVTTNPRAMHHATLTVTPLSISEYQGMAQSDRLAPEFWLDKAVRKDLKGRARVAPPKNSPYKSDHMIRFGVYSTYARNNVRHTPKGTARFLPKGYHLLLDIHHHGTGKVEKEKTTLHFYEIEKTPKIKPIHRLDQIGTKFGVPPNRRAYKVKLPTFVAEKDMKLMTCNAHMHMRGRALHAWAVLPNKKIERVLTISSFLYDWHSGMAAVYANAKVFPKGTRIESYAIIDNSRTNPFNPDPNSWVRFGQTLDKHEMPKLQCSYIEM